MPCHCARRGFSRSASRHSLSASAQRPWRTSAQPSRPCALSSSGARAMACRKRSSASRIFCCCSSSMPACTCAAAAWRRAVVSVCASAVSTGARSAGVGSAAAEKSVLVAASSVTMAVVIRTRCMVAPPPVSAGTTVLGRQDARGRRSLTAGRRVSDGDRWRRSTVRRTRVAYTIDRDVCEGIGDCVAVCPTECIAWVDGAVNAKGTRHTRIDAARCTGCGACMYASPIEDAVIDEWRPALQGDPPGLPCIRCRNAIADGQRFCPACGAPVAALCEYGDVGLLDAKALRRLWQAVARVQSPSLLEHCAIIRGAAPEALVKLPTRSLER